MPTPKTDQLLLRDAVSTDIPFITNSYLRSYRDASLNRLLTDTAFYKNHVPAVNEMMRHPTSNIKIYANPEHPDQIYGYVWYFKVGEEVSINWVYVKLPFRKFGLAGGLLSVATGSEEPVKGLIFTHYNENLKLFYDKYQPVYRPWYYFKELTK